MNRLRNRSWAVVVLAVALSACGGGGGGGGGGAGSVSAGEYADTVCGSLNTWLGAVKERASTVTDALSPTSSPDEGKQVLGDYLDGIIDDTDTMVSTIRDSGAPDVDNGAGISDTLVKALESTEKTFQAARDQVDSLPTQSVEAFRAAAQVLAQSIQTHISEVGTALQSISSADLDAAFTSSSECRKLSSASG